MTIDAGSKLPDHILDTTEGPVSLSDLGGRKLVLFLYPKDDTSGCTREAREFSDLFADFAAANTLVIGVSRDSMASHRRFADKHGLAMPLASDPELTLISALGSWVEKSMYGRKYMGIDRSTFLAGPDGTILEVWRRVKVPGHAAAVLAAADGAG
jgi:peroxiredoxin Q/BCP